MSIVETTFGPKRYLVLRKSIPTSQISDKQMYDEAGKKLSSYLQKSKLTPSGGWSVLYFSWDEKNEETDIGISFPVNEIKEVNDPELSIVDIPNSKASMDTLLGPYEGLSEIHKNLMKYVTERGYSMSHTPVLSVEEYQVDPMNDPNPNNWKTNIYYLHN